MNQRTVFEVGDASPCNDGAWLVRGRAYEDIRVGDIIHPEDAATTIDEGDLQFRVVSISTYGHEIEELGRMHTGDLVVHGQRGDRLKGARFLVRRVQQAGQALLVAEQSSPDS